MPLNCQFTIDPTAITDGQQVPIVTIALTVSNPGATAVAVTGVDVHFSDRSVNQVRPGLAPLALPMGQNQSNIIQAGATVMFGPFPIAIWSSGKLNVSAMIRPDSSPLSTSGSPQYPVLVGGIVYGSDGTANVASPSRLLISLSSAPARAYVGGNADFSSAGDSALLAAVA